MKNYCEVKMPAITFAIVSMVILMANIPEISSWNCSCGDSSVRRTIQNISAQGHQVDHLTHLCPYNMRIDHDPNRMPPEIIYAEPNSTNNDCKWPIEGLTIDNETAHCTPVDVSVYVTLNCADGCRTCLETYPVAFICSCKHGKSKALPYTKREGSLRINPCVRK